MVIVSADRHTMYEVGEVSLVPGLRGWKLVDGYDTVLKRYSSEGDGIRDLEYVASRYAEGDKVVHL